MTENIISGTLTGVIMLIVGALMAKVSLRSKAEESVIEVSRRMRTVESALKEHIEESGMRNQVILESLLAIMLSIKKQGSDKKIEEALHSLNNFIINKGAN